MYVFRVPNQRKEVKRWGQYVKNTIDRIFQN